MNKEKLYPYLISIAFVVSVLQGAAQEPINNVDKQEAKHTIDRLLSEQVNNRNIPGAVILIRKDGRDIIRKAYGHAKAFDYHQRPLTEPQEMTTEHLFDIASLTKVIGTTSGIMWLADHGMISVEDRVGNYINGFDTGSKKAITIRHLLTHTSGLMEWYPLYYRSSSRPATLQLIASLPLK